MSRVLLLDAGPLGMVTHPSNVGDARACKDWLQRVLAAGERVLIPEIADYEVRRELLRAGKVRSVERLDDLAEVIEFLPLTTRAMRRAAELWARVRKTGKPTADPHALDADVILAAQGLTMESGVESAIVVSGNVEHLSRLIDAQHWSEVE